MKPSATPKSIVLSSPGRPEKLPTPGLARILFLRDKSSSKIGRCKSSRARSGPIFVSRSKDEGGEKGGRAGEPSSPKVTCIGQVRIRNRNKNKNKIKKINNSASSSTPLPSTSLLLQCYCCCCCACGGNVCPRQQKQKQKQKQKKETSPYGFFSWRKRKKTAVKNQPYPRAEHVPPIAFGREPAIGSESLSDREESEEDEEVEETKVFVTSSLSSPPKNALLLMRCRSAPHNRSSALATCRFVADPAPESGGEGEGEEVVVVKEEKEQEVDEEKVTAAAVMPVSLTRCSSEPAKRGEKLMEMSYGKCSGSGGGSGGSEDEEGRLVSSPTPPTLIR